MAEGNYCDYLKSDMVKIKKYFYVLRPVLACKWILHKQTKPPMLFSALMESELEPSLKPVVKYLLDIKMNVPEIKEIPKIEEINNYLDESFTGISGGNLFRKNLFAYHKQLHHIKIDWR